MNLLAEYQEYCQREMTLTQFRQLIQRLNTQIVALVNKPELERADIKTFSQLSDCYDCLIKSTQKEMSLFVQCEHDFNTAIGNMKLMLPRIMSFTKNYMKQCSSSKERSS